MRAILASVALLTLAAASALAAGDGIAICSKCPGTTLAELTGADTDDARAVARVTDADMRNYCEGWHPDYSAAELSRCVREGWEVKTVKASADCSVAQLTVEGVLYRAEGEDGWIDIGGTFSRPGTDTHSTVSANWSLLCPNVDPSFRTSD